MSSPEIPAAESDNANEECPVLEPNHEVIQSQNNEDFSPNEPSDLEEGEEQEVGVEHETFSNPESSEEQETQPLNVDTKVLESDPDCMKESTQSKISNNGSLRGSGLVSRKAGGSSTRSTDSNSTCEIITRKRAASVTASSEDIPRAKLGRNSTNSSNNNDEKDESSDGADGEEFSDEFHDKYCWICHKTGVQVSCRICPRTYHPKCVPDVHVDENKSCVCYECNAVMKAENINNRSEAMKLMTMDQLMSLLMHICSRMKMTPGVDPFLNPVQREDAEDYYDYVVYPMDIGKLEKNIKNKQYGSTEAFLADAQWIVHNSIIFNSASSPYTNCAKRLLKICKQELAEIETCPECYSNAHTNPNWFVEPCKRPHLLVWAKLKGFPFWPAKAMKINNDQVDVRFFGQHDRAWVNLKDCFLYSIEQPGAAPKKSAQLGAAIEELNGHVDKLKEIYGEVTFAEPKTEIGPSLSVDQIRRLLPKYVGEEPSKQRVSAQVKPKPASKSPVTLTISSLKTNPVIKSNSATEQSFLDDDSEPDATEEMDLQDEQEEIDLPTTVSTVKPENHEDEAMESDSIKNDTAGSKSEEEVRVPSGILASALGLRRITRRQSDSLADDQNKGIDTENKGQTVESVVKFMKSEYPHEEDKDNESDENSIEDPTTSTKMQTKTQDLMEQISSQAQTKPGYRFNISKDISISAIGDEGEEPEHASTQSILKSAVGSPVTTARKSLGYHIVPTTIQEQRLVRPSVPAINVQVVGRSIVSGGLTKGNAQQSQLLQQQPKPNSIIRPGLIAAGGGTGQRFFLNKDGSIRPIVKPANQTSKPQLQQQVRSLIRPPTRGIMPLRPIAPKLDLPGDLPGNQSAPSISGAITLPGGTITVTPLTPAITTSSNSSHMPNLNGQVNGISGIGKNTPSSKRCAGPALPQAINTQIAQCMKAVQDQLRSSIEQIASEIIESGVGSNKIDQSVLVKEKEQLMIKHAKEFADLRHNHEIAFRELRTSMENEKRKVVNELRRQFEIDKNRALEEAKKKQWCARCAREAQFYCCWNTSYCGYHCQEEHWPQHMSSCTQNKAETGTE